jgi:1,4-dihydroxy-2-naphthoate octaprenyltransferase
VVFRAWLFAVGELLLLIASLVFDVGVASLLGYQVGRMALGVPPIGRVVVGLVVGLVILSSLLFLTAIASKVLEEWLSEVKL